MRKVPMARSGYEVRVVGTLGPAARDAFADLDLDLDVEPTTTILSGEVDQAELHAVLERVRALGLELVDVRSLPVAGSTSPAGDEDADRPSP
jgi:hypothetical protein